MKPFIVIYSFLCPHCNHLQNGKKLFRANNGAEASHMLAACRLRCAFCSPPRTFTAVTKALVFPATDTDLAETQAESSP
jgi:hypothetical protein